MLILIAATVAFLVGDIAIATNYDLVRLPIEKETSAGEEIRSVVVTPGDHLWRIASRTLEGHATDAEIASVWRHVIDINLPHLRSGDPDLIYPGEIVALPSERP